MEIQTNFSLQNYNTFGIEAKAREFVAVHNKLELRSILENYKSKKKFILGGGSNMLLTKDIDALVIHVDLKGKKIIKEDDNFAWVESQAGENWHEFVIWTIDQNFGGLENMSLIPGNVGTTPVQNIGAYGTEIKDTFDSCEAIKIENQEMKTFTKAECHFGYRESVFKNPILLKSDFEKIHQQFPQIKYYEVSETEVKIPAGWLIEQAGFKGKRFGDAGIHKNQALVLVNYGNATGQEILDVSKNIQETIFKTYGIHIEAEVNVI